MPAKGSDDGRRELAGRLGALQAALGLSDQDFGALFNRSRKQPGAWRRGEQLPHQSVLERVAEKQGWPVAIFQDGGPDPATAARGTLTARPADPPAPRGLGLDLGVRRATTQEIAVVDPRLVPRLALVELMQDMGPDGPIDRLAWWLERAFDAGRRHGAALADHPADTGTK